MGIKGLFWHINEYIKHAVQNIDLIEEIENFKR